MASSPKLILVDEPLAGVAPITVKDIQKIIHQLKKLGLGILTTDHNIRESLKITDRSYTLSEREILKEGTMKQLIQDKKLERFT